MRILNKSELNCISGANVIIDFNDNVYTIILTQESDAVKFESNAFNLSFRGNGYVFLTGAFIEPTQKPKLYPTPKQDVMISSNYVNNGYKFTLEF